MTALDTLAYELGQAAKTERRHHEIGRLWQNLPLLGSYAFSRNEAEVDANIARKKRALRKAWPELAKLLDEIATNSPRR